MEKIVVDKKAEAALKRERVKKALERDMHYTHINLRAGKVRLLTAIRDIGVRKIVRYFNTVEKSKTKVLRNDDGTTKVVKKVFDYGIIFDNGEEIRHVDSKVFNYLKKEGNDILEKRERVTLKVNSNELFT